MKDIWMDIWTTEIGDVREVKQTIWSCEYKFHILY